MAAVVLRITVLNLIVMNYDDVIASAKTVLVEFYASWCPHCRAMMPVVEQVKELLDGRVKVYQFDIDENKEWADDLKVESIPTFIVYRDGVEMWRQSGEMAADVLLTTIQKYV